ncbi:MAG: hypothetical protein NTZ56_19605 [Acidobacteria bacterium]|nr:hypothetical protein [Acidobacteriota bacterium]
MRQLTYARSRLWLGISGVGFFVLLASLALVTRLPYRLLPVTQLPLWQELLWVSAVLAAYTVLSWPFDFLGGYHLPCTHARMCQMLPAFVWTCVRGAAGHCTVTLIGAGVLLTAGRAGGRLAAVGAAAVLMIALVVLQAPISRLVGGLHRVRADLSAVEAVLQKWKMPVPPILVFRGVDGGFSGGVAGFPGVTHIVIPDHWLRHLAPEEVAVEIVRRYGAVATGSRARGVLLAMAWNLSGLWLATYQPLANFDSVAGLVSLALAFNAWSFLGLLVLPTLSRAGVLEADAFARKAGVPAAWFDRTISSLDQMQDDEPARPDGIETIFHPIPSVARRQQEFSAAGEHWGAWHAARMALYLSWGSMGLLARAVHCNSGRPELWVMLPAD